MFTGIVKGKGRIAAMEKRDAKKGIASLCIGGGEATAIAIERA